MDEMMSISDAPEFAEVELAHLENGHKVIIVQKFSGEKDFWRILIVDPCGPNNEEITIFVPENGIGYTDELTAYSIANLFDVMDNNPVLLRPPGVDQDNPVWSPEDV